ncbi:hypothetical protein HG536_0B02750 [Torulaspora globosa]|uniref:Uncharacterized protein n=1 Tax=Torulaspora globosa TaxID=48254 RepID=A0A7G3ZD26_9SACH|nr:uncharacterized protein HG536_0B02750 [Torulaspora globosa]QLL31412.1 hypothetical protein HG536_0B02750 [Torulaspora globosa]
MARGELLHLGSPIIPTHYEIQLDIDPVKINFKGNETITFKKNGNKDIALVERFRLHCKDLVILHAAFDEGKRVSVEYDKAGEMATFIPDEPINITESEPLHFKLQYIGKVRSVRTRQDETRGIFKTNFMNQGTGSSDNFIIATHCQPSFARSVFPCVDEPSVKTTFRLGVRTLGRFKVISNMGQSSSVEDENGPHKTVSFKMTPLMTTSVFGFAIGDFEHSASVAILPRSSRKLPIGIYSPMNVNDGSYCLDIVQKYLPLLEDYTSADYPLDKLDFVLLPFLTDMAMENFGMISVQMDHLLLPESLLADRNTRMQVEQLVVHELVHQWMGNYISFESWEFLWFNEAFATWCACSLLEANGDLMGYWISDDYLSNQVEKAMRVDAEVGTPSIAKISKEASVNKPSQTHDLFDPHSYMKGITILRSLELCIGDKLFKSALGTLFQDRRFHEKCVKPIDIFVSMGAILKSENVARFFTSLTQTPGLPVVSVQMTRKDEEVMTYLVQHRLLTSEDPDLEDVPYHIPLFIQLPDGQLDKKHVLMTDRTVTLDYPIVVCNHLSQGYYRVSYESADCYEEVARQIAAGKLAPIDLLKIFRDLSFFIDNSAKEIHFVGLFLLLKHLASNRVDLVKNPQYWPALGEGLQILQNGKLKGLKYAAADSEILDYRADVLKPLANKINRTRSKACEPHQSQVLSILQQLKKA